MPEVAVQHRPRLPGGSASLVVEHLGVDDGTPVIAVRGDLDLTVRDELLPTLCLFGQMFGDVVVDLSGVLFCDASGLRVLYDVHEHLSDVRGRLILRCAPPLLERLLRLTDLDTFFNIEPMAVGLPVSG